jgi:hypothetical protein
MPPDMIAFCNEELRYLGVRSADGSRPWSSRRR